MHANGRTLFGGALASAAVMAAPRLLAGAQEASPEPAPGAAPGFGIARVRTHASPETLQAVYADVLSTFLPATQAVPGYGGYVFAFDGGGPTASINITLLADAAAADAASTVAMDYVAGMDPRLTPETPFAEQGAIRVFETATEAAGDLLPLLNGCQITMRQRVNAPEADMETVVGDLNSGLTPILKAMDGFILYCWILTEDGRVAINIWESAEQLVAGDEAVTAWAAENTRAATVGEPLVHQGVIGYTDLFSRN